MVTELSGYAAREGILPGTCLRKQVRALLEAVGVLENDGNRVTSNAEKAPP